MSEYNWSTEYIRHQYQVVTAALHGLATSLGNEGDTKARNEIDAMSLRIGAIGRGEHKEESPADMAELAKLVAKELRSPRGIRADHYAATVQIEHPNAVHNYSMYHSDFDNLTPSECANLIQAEEAKRAAEWAGDE